MEASSEFRGRAAQISPKFTLRACARLSVLFNYGPDAGTTDAGTTASEKAIVKWTPLLFPTALVSRIKILASRKRVIFFQAQLRYLAAEVVRLDQYGSEDPYRMAGHFLQEKGDGAGRLFDMDARLKAAINVMHHQLSANVSISITGSRPAHAAREYRLSANHQRLPALR